MRRTALTDTAPGGKAIQQGDKVVRWCRSANRDGDALAQAKRFIIDRDRPRQQWSFGFGTHRCVGIRLAEMQVTILCRALLPRFPVIEVVGPPRCTLSNFVRGFTGLQVRRPA